VEAVAVGANGTVLVHDGRVWSARSSGVTANLYGVWGPEPHVLYAVGDRGTILRFSLADSAAPVRAPTL